MKKTLIASAAALALAAAAAIAPAAVSAATPDGSAQGTTTAEFEVTAGDGTDEGPGGDHGSGENANLWLVKAPDLHFANATVANIITKDTDLAYVDGTVSNKPDPADAAANSNGELQVSDLRGNNAGWTLTASVDRPYNGKTHLDGTLNLAFNSPVSQNTNTAAPVEVTLTTDNTAGTVWDAVSTTGQGKNTASVDGSKTTFTIKKNAQVTKGIYDATVTWTLGSTVTPN